MHCVVLVTFAREPRKEKKPLFKQTHMVTFHIITSLGVVAGGISRGFAAGDGSAVKSHSTTLQRLRRQISHDYYTNLVPRAFPLKNGWGGKRPWHRLVTCPLVHPKILGVIN